MEQGLGESIAQILAGVLFLAPLRRMFRRVLTRLKRNPKRESYLQYNFPTLYRWAKHKK
jgi:hypothetical protein